MALSTLLKIIVGFLNFVIAAFIIRNALKDIKLKGKIQSNKFYLFLLIVIMILSTLYTSIDGYDAKESNREISHLNNKLDTMKVELNIAKTDRDIILNSLISSNTKLKEIQNKLNPFLAIALESYPNTDTTLALYKLYNEIEKIKKDVLEASLQSEFKPVQNEFKNQIITELKKSTILKNINFLINDWSGKRVNRLVAKEISDIIKEAGLSCRVQGSFGLQGGYTPPPIEINVEPTNVQAFEEFKRIFMPLFFDYQPKLRAKKGMHSTLRVRIFGTPTFKLDGRIKYQ